MSSMILVPNASSTVSSVTLAAAIGMQHSHLLRTIRKTCSSCPESIIASNFGFNNYESKRGLKPQCDVSQDGMLLLLPFLPSNDPKVAIAKIVSQMRQESKEKDKKLKAAEETINSLQTKLLGKMDQLETNEYGTRVKKLNIPSEDKTIIAFDAEENKVKRVKVIEMSRIKLAYAMQTNAEKRLAGVQSALDKIDTFISALEDYYDEGDMDLPCPTPSDFGIVSEYQDRFEKDAQIEDFED